METDNLEMMCHFEGPIVDSFYDMALISWHKALEPPLPTLDRPTTAEKWGGKDEAQQGLHQTPNGTPVGEPANTRTSTGSYVSPPSSPSTSTSSRDRLPEHDPYYDPDIASEAARAQASVSPPEGGSRVAAVTEHLSTHS